MSESGTDQSNTREGAQQRAGEVKDKAGSVAGDVKDQAREQAGSIADDVQNRVSDVVGNARSELQQHADGQAQKAAGGLRDLAGQLHSMAEGGDPGPATDAARQASQRLDHVASRLEDGGIEGVLDDVARFARQRPAMFLMGAGLAGFAVGRLVRHVDVQAVKPGGNGSGSGDTRKPAIQSQQGGLPGGAIQPPDSMPTVTGVPAMPTEAEPFTNRGQIS